MKIIRFDGFAYGLKVNRSVSFIGQGLRLNAGKYRTATTFFKVAVCLVTGDVFVATLAVRQQGN